MTDLFITLAEGGYLVNNLYQLDDGSWRASLRVPSSGGDYFTAFGEGDTHTEALEAALNHVDGLEWFPDKPVSSSIDSRPEPSAPRLSLSSLGLAKPQEPLKRRTIA